MTKSGFRSKTLSEADADMLYEKCLALLSKKGVKVQHREALKILGEAGAQVDLKGEQVSFPIGLIEECLRHVPASCELSARNGRSDLILPHPEGLFYTSTTTGGRRYIDPKTLAHRDATLDDVVEFGQLSEMLSEIDVTAFQSPTDVPPETADVHALRALLESTSKHICVQPYSLESLEYLFELATVVAGSSGALRERPIIDLIVCSVSPFVFKPMDVEAILWSCRHGVPIMACSLPSAGGTSPITMAGTVLVASVEVLAILVMSQIIAAGTPFVACPIVFALDMATGEVQETSAEAIIGATAVTEFVKDRFHVPASTLGFGSDAHIPDEQCMIEDCLLAETIALGRSNDILWEAGSLQSIAAFSPVQLIIDDTITRLLKRILSGVCVDEETLAWQDVLDIVPGGSFIDRPHTLQHCRDPLRPGLFDRSSLELWKAGGSKRLYDRALERYLNHKKALKPLALPEFLKKEMGRIVAHADQNLAKTA